MVISTKLPAHEIVTFVGDNIQDFPTFHQKDMTKSKYNKNTFEKFGYGYFILPNPIHGSW
jgi:predicted secreted acid phosphatase